MLHVLQMQAVAHSLSGNLDQTAAALQHMSPDMGPLQAGLHAVSQSEVDQVRFAPHCIQEHDVLSQKQVVCAGRLCISPIYGYRTDRKCRLPSSGSSQSARLSLYSAYRLNGRAIIMQQTWPKTMLNGAGGALACCGGGARRCHRLAEGQAGAEPGKRDFEEQTYFWGVRLAIRPASHCTALPSVGLLAEVFAGAIAAGGKPSAEGAPQRRLQQPGGQCPRTSFCITRLAVMTLLRGDANGIPRGKRA